MAAKQARPRANRNAAAAESSTGRNVARHDGHLDPGPEYVHHSFWAWIDEGMGSIRARVFASWVGVPEDPATGSAALRLVDQLQRSISILQGEDCIIQARPGSEAGTAEVGGFVVEDAMRVVQA